MDLRRWLRRAVMLTLFAGTLASVRAAGFALNRRRTEGGDAVPGREARATR